MNNKISTADQSYSNFLETLDPVSIALVQSASTVDRVKYLKSQQERIHVSFGSKLIRLGDGHFDVKTTLDLQVKKMTGSKALLRFGATYELHFHATEANQENVDRFVKSDVRLFMWPYLREFVSNMSARMHIPPLLLPVGKPSEEPESD